MIQARTYPVQVSRRSTSFHVYLFDDTTQAQPPEGKIILLRKGNDAVMAFRVLKSYTEKNQFAALRVKMYGMNRVLDSGQSFTAIEKTGEITPPPPLSSQDKNALKEVELPQNDYDKLKIAPYDPALDTAKTPIAPPTSVPTVNGKIPTIKDFDPELDASTSPPVSDDDSAGNNDEDERLGLEIEEIPVLDPHNQWLSASLGYLLNSGLSGGIGFYAGGGFRYGYTVARQALLRSAKVQDSITLEGGVFLYKILGTANDGYTVLPLEALIRYNLQFGEKLRDVFDAGLMQNFVVAASQPVASTLAGLGSLVPAGGLGFFFRVGPNWDLRVDLGVDVLGLGITLRF